MITLILPIFSPDSKRVAYRARSGNKDFIVIDGVEGQQYEAVLSKIIFDNPNNIHYIAMSDKKIYLVEEVLE